VKNEFILKTLKNSKERKKIGVLSSPIGVGGICPLYVGVKISTNDSHTASQRFCRASHIIAYTVKKILIFPKKIRKVWVTKLMYLSILHISHANIPDFVLSKYVSFFTVCSRLGI